jgi:predicted DCC family thiol-disulfide oxidoreductase YuxK
MSEMSENHITAKWNKFWFEPASPVAMAIFRILFGLIVLEDLLVHLYPDFALFYLKNSLVPINDMIALFWHRSALFDAMLLLPPGDQYIWATYWVLVAATVCTILGLFTRVSSWIVFFLLMSFSSHFELNQNAGDNYIRIMAMGVALSNAGDALSLDNLIKSLRQDWRVTGFGARLSAPWAQRLIMVQLSIAYFHAWYVKMKGAHWNDGTAVYYAVRYDDLVRFPIPHFLDQLWVYQILTWGTLVIEFALFTLIWFRPTRYWVLLTGLSLHLGIEYCMNLPMFEWVFMFTYILYLYPEDLSRSWTYIKALIVSKFGEPYKLAYDGDCLFCVRVVGLIHRLDVFGRLRPVDFRADEKSELGEIDLDRAEKEILINTRKKDKSDKENKGTWLGGFQAFRFICARLPLLAILTPFLYLPVVAQLGAAIYSIVAANRQAILGGSCSHESCKVPAI